MLVTSHPYLQYHEYKFIMKDMNFSTNSACHEYLIPYDLEKYTYFGEFRGDSVFAKHIDIFILAFKVVHIMEVIHVIYIDMKWALRSMLLNVGGFPISC